MFRIAHSANFNTSIQALMLIQQISSRSNLYLDRFYRTLYDSLMDPRLLRSSKQTMYLNLLYRSLKADTSLKRIKAFVKRLLQTLSLHEPPFICAALYLVGELQVQFPGIRALFDQPEAYEDSDINATDDVTEESKQYSSSADVDTLLALSNETKTRQSIYDGRKRDPEHSNAHLTCLWEALPWEAHFHPSVSLFAHRLMTSTGMPEKPDPSLHTLVHFLDRFAYRNAKLREDVTRGQSIMQPALASESTDALFIARDVAKLKQPLNTEDFWNKQPQEVAVDEAFFHTYFNQRKPVKSRAAEDVKSGTGSESSDEGSDDDENKIWKALVGSRRDLEGSDEGDDGLELEMSETDDELISQMLEGDEGAEDELFDDDFDLGGKAEAVGFNDSDAFAQLEGLEEFQGSQPVESFDGANSRLDEDKSSRNADGARKRRKLSQAPVFAAAEDYADMLDRDDSENEF